jgi:transcriptional regulator of heat shock response
MPVHVDVEKWKQAEMEKFRLKLKQKEEGYLQAMDSEWKKRITDQEFVVVKKRDECLKLEDRLKKMLSELEKREQKLFTAEEELRRTKVVLQSEYEAKLTQVESIEKQAARGK